MRKIAQWLLLLCSTLSLHAATTITTPTVSGVWNLAGSPYKIYNDIKVVGSTSLTIEPGVEVIFMGYYQFDVRGSLFAAGTETGIIRFHINDTLGWYNTSTTAGAWKGIAISYYSEDSCSFSYCNVSDVKNSCALNFYRNRSINIEHCNFFHNNGISGAVVGVTGYNKKLTFSHCKVYDNACSVAGQFTSSSTSVTVSQCKFYRNTSYNTVVLLAGKGLALTGNDFYKNSSSEGIIMSASSSEPVGDCVAKIRYNRIYDNVCKRSGAIRCSYGKVDIESNIICNNRRTESGPCGATHGGGAIFLQSDYLYPVDSCFFNVKNNVIANNYSTDFGGGLELFQAKANIINNTFINNRASSGGAIYIFGDRADSVNIINNVFHGNISEESMLASIEGMDTARIFFDHNYMSRPLYKEVDIFFNTVIGDSTTNVIDSLPGFVAPTVSTSLSESAITANFRPLSTSPCIGRGLNAVITTGDKDCAGYTRINGDSVDIGAYEWFAGDVEDSSGTVEMDTVSTSTVTSVTGAAGLDGTDGIVKIYPNPAKGAFSVITSITRGVIRVVDLSGRLIAKKNVDNLRTSFETQDIPAGMYIIALENEAGRKDVKKLIIQ